MMNSGFPKCATIIPIRAMIKQEGAISRFQAIQYLFTGDTGTNFKNCLFVDIIIFTSNHQNILID